MQLRSQARPLMYYIRLVIEWPLHRWEGVQTFAAESRRGFKGSPTAREWLDRGSKCSGALGPRSPNVWERLDPGVHKKGGPTAL